MVRHVVMRGFIFIGIMLLIGTTFFSFIEDLSVIDAFYLSGSTITTVGYGNISPETDVGKVFSVIYSIVGIGTVFFILGKLFHILFMNTLLDPVFHERHQLYSKELMEKIQKKARKRKTKKR